MPGLQVIRDGEGAFSDIAEDDVVHGLVERVTILRNGTRGGRATIALLIALDDGGYVVAETTYRLAHIAAGAIAATPIAAEEVLDG